MPANIYTYNKKIEENFVENYKKISKSISVEGIHNMRLSVKRLRALLGFLDFMNEKPKTKKLLKRIRKLYRSAGALRDIQIQTNILKSYKKYLRDDYNLYVKQLNEKKGKARKKLKQSLHEFDINDFIKIRKRIEKSFKNIEKHRIIEGSSQMFQNRLEEIEKLSFTITDDSVLHLIRKYMKEMIYIRDSIGDNSFFLQNSNKMQLFSELEVKLGKWHDLTVFIDHFLLFKNKGDTYWDMLKILERDKLLSQDLITEKLKEFSA